MSNMKKTITSTGVNTNLEEGLSGVFAKTGLNKAKLIGNIQENIVMLQKELENTEYLLEKANRLDFDKGSIVYHRTLGAAIVQEIRYYCDGDFYSKHPYGAYIRILIAHSEGVLDCVPEELVASNKLSESIYGE